MRNAVVVSTARTPIGKAYRGAFNDTPSQTLAAHAISAAVERAGIEGGEVEDVSSPGGGEVFTAHAVWSSGRRVYVFVADDSGTAAYVLNMGRRPRLVRVWQNGSGGTSPVLAGGLLYVYDEQGGSLNIYNPVSGSRLRSLDAAGGHWNSPIAVGGRVILPTGNANAHSSGGRIFVYHLPGR